jgi:hypothetical protein
MEHVNDDMDELFRKAGDLYPLRTTDSDWEGVMGKLRDEISGEKGIPYSIPSRGNSNRRRWLLLLLIPAFIFSLIYLNNSHGDKKNIRITENIQPSAKSKIPVGKSESKVSAIRSSSPTSPVNNRSADPNGQSNQTSASIRGSGNNPVAENGTETQTGRKLILSESTSDLANNPSDNLNHEATQKPLLIPVFGLSENLAVHGTPLPSLKQTNITTTSKNEGTLKKANSVKSTDTKGIYAVFLGGPDWSTVALQSTEQAGYSLGLLVGYRFNKRFSIESGLLWDKKNYYSDGKYFDKSKTSIPDSVSIKNLDGFCNMFEIPINLRYSFAIRNNHNFFLGAGLSSYLMKKEYYDYTAEKTYWGWPPVTSTYTGHTTYKNSTNNFFSILQISGGYEYSIGKSTEIRIEPYVKIPLQGLGIGSMPISSAGLYFGISHTFR